MGQLDRGVESLARWWTSAPQEERFRVWQKAIRENSPPLEALRLAVILAETEAGEVSEG